MELIKKLSIEEVKDLASKEGHEDERMQEYLVNNYDYYKTTDEIIIEIEKPKHLSINKTIWYDDELPADEIPSASYENFIYANRHNCNRYKYYSEEISRKGTKFYFCKQDSNIGYIDYDRYEDYYNYGKCRYSIREITKEEMQEILQLYKTQKEEYLKRLERYFKRYGKHISAQGYWRDR